MVALAEEQRVRRGKVAGLAQWVCSVPSIERGGYASIVADEHNSHKACGDHGVCCESQVSTKVE